MSEEPTQESSKAEEHNSEPANLHLLVYPMLELFKVMIHYSDNTPTVRNQALQLAQDTITALHLLIGMPQPKTLSTTSSNPDIAKRLLNE